MKNFIAKHKKISNLLLIIFLCFIAILPTLLSQTFIDSDLTFHMHRMNEISRNMKDEIFLPFLQGDNIFGYGYLVDIFYPNTFLYVGAVFNLFFSVPASFKLMLFTYNLFSFFLVYFCLRYKGDKFAFLFSMITLFFPIRIANFYINGFMGEYFAYTFIPLAIFGMEKLLQENKWKLLVIGIVGLLYTHLITFAVACIYLFVYLVFNIKKLNKQVIISLLKAIILSTVLSLGFLIPFFDVYYSDTFKMALNAEKSGIVPLLFNININPALKVIVQILPAILLVVIYNKNKNNKPALDIPLILYIFQLSTGLFPWELLANIPFLNSIQFGQRILPLLIIPIGNLLIHTIIKIKGMQTPIILFLVSIVLVVSNGISQAKIKPPVSLVGDNVQVLENTYVDVVAGEYIPANLSFDGEDVFSFDFKVLLEEQRAIPENDAKTTFIKEKPYISKITVDTDEPTNLTVPLIYYKYYTATLNGEPIPVFEKNGKIYLKDITSGEVVVTYEISNIQKISAVISLLAFSGMIIDSIYHKKKSVNALKSKN